MAETLASEPSEEFENSQRYIQAIPSSEAPPALPLYGDVVVPLRPLTEAFFEYCGNATTNPYAAQSFLRERVQAEASGRGMPLLLPEGIVMAKLQHTVIPNQFGTPSYAQQTERDGAIRKAVLHYSLPEIGRAILLHQSLKRLDYQAEAASVASVLEAYGRSITEMGEDANLFRWARIQIKLRRQAQGLE